VTFKEALDKFAVLHPEYSTPDGARNKCIQASGEFIDFLIAHGFIEEKCRRWEWEVMEYTVVDGLSHHAARVGFVLVDWTARQFDAAEPWPKLITDPECWNMVRCY